MAFKFASLGSGSQGNGLLVSSSKTSLLVDCGFSTVETERRLHRLSVTPESVDAILVTHEHGDHVGGVAGLAKKYSIQYWLNIYLNVSTLLFNEITFNSMLNFGYFFLNIFLIFLKELL